MTRAEAAWLAGLFEGEGSIILTKRTKMIAVVSTDEDVIRRVREIAGVGAVTSEDRSSRGHKTLYRWTVCAWPERRRLLHAMLPWLGERRRARAEAMLAQPAAPAGSPRKTHCKRNHPLEGPAADVYEHRDRRGIIVRHCRPCIRERRGVKVAAGRPRGHKPGCGCRPCRYIETRELHAR